MYIKIEIKPRPDDSKHIHPSCIISPSENEYVTSISQLEENIEMRDLQKYVSEFPTISSSLSTSMSANSIMSLDTSYSAPSKTDISVVTENTSSSSTGKLLRDLKDAHNAKLRVIERMSSIERKHSPIGSDKMKVFPSSTPIVTVTEYGPLFGSCNNDTGEITCTLDGTGETIEIDTEDIKLSHIVRNVEHGSTSGLDELVDVKSINNNLIVVKDNIIKVRHPFLQCLRNILSIISTTVKLPTRGRGSYLHFNISLKLIVKRMKNLISKGKGCATGVIREERSRSIDAGPKAIHISSSMSSLDTSCESSSSVYNKAIYKRVKYDLFDFKAPIIRYFSHHCDNFSFKVKNKNKMNISYTGTWNNFSKILYFLSLSIPLSVTNIHRDYIKLCPLDLLDDDGWWLSKYLRYNYVKCLSKTSLLEKEESDEYEIVYILNPDGVSESVVLQSKKDKNLKLYIKDEDKPKPLVVGSKVKWIYEKTGALYNPNKRYSVSSIIARNANLVSISSSSSDFPTKKSEDVRMKYIAIPYDPARRCKIKELDEFRGWGLTKINRILDFGKKIFFGKNVDSPRSNVLKYKNKKYKNLGKRVDLNKLIPNVILCPSDAKIFISNVLKESGLSGHRCRLYINERKRIEPVFYDMFDSKIKDSYICLKDVDPYEEFLSIDTDINGKVLSKEEYDIIDDVHIYLGRKTLDKMESLPPFILLIQRNYDFPYAKKRILRKNEDRSKLVDPAEYRKSLKTYMKYNFGKRGYNINHYSFGDIIKGQPEYLVASLINYKQETIPNIMIEI